jgi:pimeloyl-ACP methyl ester carboxylesterase
MILSPSILVATQTPLTAVASPVTTPTHRRAEMNSRPRHWRAGILLHGWPYDIHSYVDVAPLLAAAGYRVIVPAPARLRHTRFLSTDTPRNGQQSALAVDIIALMDALKIDKATVAGCDWGARTACIMAALWPERVQGAGLGQRLPDRQPGGRQGAAAAGGRAAVVVPVLLRHRARPRRLREEPARLRQADLADRIAAVGLRRRHLRPQRGRWTTRTT